MDRARSLLETLASRPGFDEAARAVLDAVGAAWEAHLDDVAPPRSRASVTLRHLGLYWQDGGAFVASVLAEGRQVAQLPTSRTLWSALQARPVPALLHLRARLLRRADGEEVLPPEGQRAATLVGLERAPLTHLLALPVPGVAGRLRGMVVLGLHAPGVPADVPPLPDADGDLAALLRLAGLTLPAFPLTGPAAGDAMRSGAARALLQALDAAPLPGPLLLLGRPGSGRRWAAAELARRRGLRLVELPAPTLRGAELDAELGPERLVLVHGLDELPRAAQLALLDRLGAASAGSPGGGGAPTGAPGLAGPLVVSSAHTPTALADAGRLLPGLVGPLSGWPLRLPPLAERLEDLPGLVAAFLGEGALPLAPEALARLRGHAWQRELRELETAAKLAAQAARAEGAAVLTLAHVEPALRRAARPDGAVLDALRPGLRLLAERAAAHPGLSVRLLGGIAGVYLAERLEAGVSPAGLADELGLAAARKEGNHLKLLRPAVDRLAELCDWLGEPPPPSLARLAAKPRRPR